MKFNSLLKVLVLLLCIFEGIGKTYAQNAFPYSITNDVKNRELSAAMKRSFYQYQSPFLPEIV